MFHLPLRGVQSMIKRVMFTTVLAAQFLAISAVKNTTVQVQPKISADMRTDDPSPCPDCDASSGPNLAELRADDPSPCPDCDASSGPNVAELRADDPSPCPDCDASSGPNVA